jgi:hypothetical protein
MPRPFLAGEAPRRCVKCRHLVIARAGDTCPRCMRIFDDAPTPRPLLALREAAAELGIVGRLRHDGWRLLGVLDGGRT